MLGLVFAGTLGLLRLLFFAGIGAHRHDFTIEHAVLLERVGRQLDLDLLLGEHKTHVVILDHDFSDQRLVVGHQRQ